jgi:16S rRNA (guanine966-N2)-methyltransferase
MRIIAGSLKGQRLATPPEGELAIRPTSDRAREALFSILEAWGKGPFLDLYGGTGAVALEALSRGFSPVTCVEKSPAPCLVKNLAGSGVRLLRQSATRLGAAAFQGQAVVFADPPYGMSAQAWRDLSAVAAPWLREGGLLVFESSSREELAEAAGWRRLEHRDYGQARFHFFIPA